MSVFIYLKHRLRPICAFLLFSAILLVSFCLYRVPAEACVYPLSLCALLGLVFLIADYSRQRGNYRILDRLTALSSDLIDALPEPASPAEDRYAVLVRKLKSEAAEIRSADEAKYREMTEYYTAWAHQIKTPIAAMKLTLENADAPVSMQLRANLFRIEQYTDMVLTYMRLESATTDYVFRTQNLDDIIRSSARKFAGEFIGKKLKLDYRETNLTVLTDEKWLSFILEQILSNAVKYTPAGSVSIYAEAPLTLCVADTGIGIAPGDLPRIFENGYTGENGRTNRSASGIGLYLSNRAAKNLGISLFAESKIGCGTVIKLRFSDKKPDFE